MLQNFLHYLFIHNRSEMSSVISHEAYSAGEKCYDCELCEFTSSDKRSLNRHRSTHSKIPHSMPALSCSCEVINNKGCYTWKAESSSYWLRTDGWSVYSLLIGWPEQTISSKPIRKSVHNFLFITSQWLTQSFLWLEFLFTLGAMMESTSSWLMMRRTWLLCQRPSSQCREYNFQTKRRWNLQVHMKKHSKPPNPPKAKEDPSSRTCTYCGTVLATKQCLEKHLRTCKLKNHPNLDEWDIILIWCLLVDHPWLAPTSPCLWSPTSWVPLSLKKEPRRRLMTSWSSSRISWQLRPLSLKMVKVAWSRLVSLMSKTWINTSVAQITK